MPDEQPIITTAKIEQIILLICGENVMLDSDLAALYGVPTKALIQAVKRNLSRFPEDFMLQLTAEEFANLRSQFVTSSSEEGWGGRRYSPYVFTEQSRRVGFRVEASEEDEARIKNGSQGWR